MRDLFHVPDNYFLSHSVGCLPKHTQSIIADSFIAPWKSGENWSQWMGIVDDFRRQMASLLGVTSDTICPQTNISSALTKIIHSLPFNSVRNKIVLTRQDFPTIGFVAKQAEHMGYEICFVDGDITQAESWAAVIDARAAFVHVTHALSNTSHILPVADICALTRKAGGVSIVDIAQSLGAVAVDISTWTPDFVTGTGVKFLCAGPGACFLYASPDILPRCAPIDVGWFSHENPFEMDIEQFRYAPDAMRFFGGTPSPAPLAAANGALAMWADIGLTSVHEAVRRHIQRLMQDLDDDVLTSPGAGQAHGGTFVISPRDRGPLRSSIKSNELLCDERNEGFRFSVHGYTSDEEIEQLASIVSQAI